MKKFEHLTIEESKLVNTSYPNDRELTKALNELGAEGWELVAVVHSDVIRMTRCYLKREVQ